MKIAIVNTGSSSVKCSLFQSAPFRLEWEKNPPSIEALSKVWGEPIDAIGHRVVHGGELFLAPALITPEVKEQIKALGALAPLHNPINLEGIEIMEKVYPGIPQVAVFDTSFFHTLPQKAYVYPLPIDWLKKGIRRYGFHGINHQYCAKKGAEILKKKNLRMISCHLGNGASLAAIEHGKSIDTTMGFTPLEGLMMGTRSGSIDPGILFYLMEQGYKYEELDHILNFSSGLKGVGGSSDMREILAKEHSHPFAHLAYKIYIHRLTKEIAAMAASLGGVDALIFTGGVGENASRVRMDACRQLSFLGIALDAELNQQNPVDQLVSEEKSSVAVLIIKAQENLSIAQDVLTLLTKQTN